MEGKNLKYSGQAKAILESLKEGTFDIIKFEDWVIKNMFVVGGGYIVKYLEKMKKGEIR